jgi:hypothetical protein
VRKLSITDIEFVDDLEIIALSEAHLQAMTSIFEKHCTAFGLKIAVSKTKVLLNQAAINQGSVSSTPETPWPGPRILIYNEPVEWVNEFKYLGSTEETEGHLSKEVSLRAQKMTRMFYQFAGRIFLNHNLPLKIKLNIYQMYVYNGGLYACESRSTKAYHRHGKSDT